MSIYQTDLNQGRPYAVQSAPSPPLYKMLKLGVIGLFIAASLGKFVNAYTEEVIPIATPFETLANNGRLLAVAALCVVTLFGLGVDKQVVKPQFNLACKALLAIQAVIVAKYVFSGVFGFLGLAITVYVCLWIVYFFVFPALLGTGVRAIPKIAELMLYIAFVFLICNLYLLRASPVGASACEGRFHGMVSNPQMFALCNGMNSASFFYFLADRRHARWKKFLATFCLVSSVYLAYLSGSRMGMVIIFANLVPFISIGLGFLIGISGFLAWAFDIDPRSWFGESEALSRITRTSDTRTMVWQSQWTAFMTYPLLGAPFTTDRLRFAENSWLALLAGTGIAGFIPALMFLLGIGQVMSAVWEQVNRSFSRRLTNEAKFLLGSILGLLVGSIFEAFLLGTLTMPLLMSYLILYASDAYLHERFLAPNRMGNNYGR